MPRRSFTALAASLLLALPAVRCADAETVDVAPLLKAVREVGPKGEGHRQAILAVRKLNQADAAQLPQILAAMDGAGELPTNWLRGVVEAVAQRGLSGDGKLPQAELEAFLADTSHSPRARRLAYELIARVDPTAHDRLIPDLLNDPSLELRRDAVAMKLAAAEKISAKQTAVKLYRQALTAARDLDQIEAATKKLRDFGETVDLSEHFGFVTRWHLIGPFDNTDKSGFDVGYPPEKEIDLMAAYPGKVGPVKWLEHATEDEYGIVDLNKAIAKHMGAVGYAYHEFDSPLARDVELRLGCINGNKVWLNGELLTANHVYHAGTQIDQYAGQGRVKKGKNQILIKVLQNEQTEDWAQNWQFQLRVCDAYGTAVLEN